MKKVNTINLYEMPRDIQVAFENSRQVINKRGNVIVWEVYPEGLLKEDLKGGEIFSYIDKGRSQNEDNWLYYVKGNDPVSDWLVEKGIKPYSTVIIKT
jgi:hypothetical protein